MAIWNDRSRELTFHQEGSDNKINLTFGESGIIKLLLVFIYTFDYDNQIHLHILEGSRLLINTDLYSAADFYDIQPLKTQAIAKFNAAAAQFWEEEEEYFPATVQKIYATTVESDRGLRDPAIKLAIKHCTELLKPELNHSPTFMEVLSNNAEVGKDLALASLPTATQFTGWVKRRCIGCNHVWGDAGMGQDCKFRVAANIRFGQVACPKCTCVHNNDCQVE